MKLIDLLKYDVNTKFKCIENGIIVKIKQNGKGKTVVLDDSWTFKQACGYWKNTNFEIVI